jgi:putative sterol carrier protein
MATPAITADQLFAQMPTYFDATKAGNINATYQFDLSGPQGGTWWVKIANGQAESGVGAIENPMTTFAADAQDYVNIALGQLNATMAFMQGESKIKGDMGLAMKLQSFFKLP